jgi:hypothetical protein
VWSGLNNPDTLKACLPGCEVIEPDGADAYRIVIAAKVGPVSARFNGRLQLADVVPSRSYTLRFDGQGGAAGFARGEAAVSLGDEEEGAATSLGYRVDAQIGGKFAQVGSRLVHAAATKVADDFFARFAVAMSAQSAKPDAESVPAALQAPSRWRRHTVGWSLMGLIVLLLMLLYLQSHP